MEYHIAGNFHMVQTFVVFADGPAIAKIRTTKVLMLVHVLPLYGAPRRACAKVKNVKVSSGALGGDFAKVCTRESFPLHGIISTFNVFIE